MRLVFFLILSFYVHFSFAQTQQGIVKTRGRMVNGQLVAGQRLSGATITLNIGNPLVSGQNGAFSFNVPSGKNYSLVTATKQGYTLADPEYTRRSFKYSAGNPFYVVLEDEAQRQADINAATRKVRRTLTAQLQEREDEIEALKAQNKLTEAEYQRRLQELYDNQSKSEQLVKEMAERYASTDYDQLDEFNRQVQMYIEEGELQKADSMIRSKGDIEQRVEEYQNVITANNKMRKTLEKSERGAVKFYEDLSQDLCHRFEIFMQEHKQDSALHCMKMRADLDTTEIRAVWQYAYCCEKQNELDEAERYYKIALSSCLDKNAEALHIIQADLGMFYTNCHKFNEGKEYLELALKKSQELFAQDSTSHRKQLAIIHTNLGNLYAGIHDDKMAYQHYMSALDIFEYLYGQDPNQNRVEIMTLQNHIGNFARNIRHYSMSQKFLEVALKNCEILLALDPDTYSLYYAQTLDNLGTLYMETGEYAKSEQYYTDELDCVRLLSKKNPKAMQTKLARAEANLGHLYFKSEDYEKSKQYFETALQERIQLYKQSPDVYCVEYAEAHETLATTLSRIKDFKSSECHYLEALHIYNQLFTSYPNVYQEDKARTEKNLAIIYSELKKISLSEEYYKHAIEDYKELFLKDDKTYRPQLAFCYKTLAQNYMDRQDFENGYDMAEKANILYPTNTNYYYLRGFCNLMLGKNDEALAMWKKVLELNPDFLKDYPDGTNLSNGLKKLGLIE